MDKETININKDCHVYTGNIHGGIFALPGTVIKVIQQPVTVAKDNTSSNKVDSEVLTQEASFRHVIQYHEPDKLLKRLHELIDDRKGADVGCVLLCCKQKNYLIRNPTQAEFCSEFKLIGTWKAIHKYLNEGDLNALERANRVIIFEDE